MQTECCPTTSELDAPDDVWHRVCTTRSGKPKHPLVYGCCGVQLGDELYDDDGVGIYCPLCELIHTDNLPCVHSGLASQ